MKVTIDLRVAGLIVLSNACMGLGFEAHQPLARMICSVAATMLAFMAGKIIGSSK